MQKFNETLRHLLNSFDRIAAGHPELTDTAVCEETGHAVLNVFCRNQKEMAIPRGFAMFSEIANLKVNFILNYFLPDLCTEAKNLGLDTFHQRLNAFQNENVISDNGHHYDLYFGHWNAEDFDENGHRLDGRDI